VAADAPPISAQHKHMPRHIRNQAHQGNPHGISEVVVVVVMSLTVLVTEQLGPVPTELQTSDVKEGLFSEACTCEDVVPGATPAVPLWDTVVLPVSRRPVVEIGGSSVTQSSLVFNAEAIAAVMSAS